MAPPGFNLAEREEDPPQDAPCPQRFGFGAGLNQNIQGAIRLTLGEERLALEIECVGEVSV